MFYNWNFAFDVNLYDYYLLKEKAKNRKTIFFMNLNWNKNIWNYFT